MANEFTLADYEQTATPITRAVVRTWREASPIMDMLSFKTSNNLTEEVLKFGTLPTVPWRKIGEAFTDVKVSPTPEKERLHFMGAKIDVPYEYVHAASIQDIRSSQSEAIMKAAAFGFNEAFFLNGPTDDEDALVGLFWRVTNQFAAAQRFDAGLDVSPDSAVTDVQYKLIDAMEDLLDRVDGEKNQKVLFMGRTLYLRVQSLLRRSNLLSTTMDQLGREFTTYGGAKIVQAGYKVDQSTQILGDAETSYTSLTSGAVSSMYCARFGDPFVAGWCQEMPTAEDVGLLENRTHYRTVVRFSPGLYITHPRSVARAYGFTAA
jgi:hypothetical protein